MTNFPTDDFSLISGIFRGNIFFQLLAPLSVYMRSHPLRTASCIHN